MNLLILYNITSTVDINFKRIFFTVYNVNVVNIERVQNRFLHFVARQIGLEYYYFSHDNKNLRSHLKIPKFLSCFIYNDIFCYKILNGLIDCPELLSKISIYILVKLFRNFATFAIPFRNGNATFLYLVELREKRIFTLTDWIFWIIIITHLHLL